MPRCVVARWLPIRTARPYRLRRVVVHPEQRKGAPVEFLGASRLYWTSILTEAATLHFRQSDMTGTTSLLGYSQGLAKERSHSFALREVLLSALSREDQSCLW